FANEAFERRIAVSSASPSTPIPTHESVLDSGTPVPVLGETFVRKNVSGPPALGEVVADNPNRSNPPLMAVCARAACAGLNVNRNPAFPIPGWVVFNVMALNAPDVNPTAPLELNSASVRLLSVIDPPPG